MAWQRRRYRGRDLSRHLTIADLREAAMRRVPRFVFEYVEGGADDEHTLRRNRAVFDELRLIPNTLVQTTGRHQRISLFGRESASPLLIAPTGGNGVLQGRGDEALASAARAAGIPFCLSTMSQVRLDELARTVGGRLWMQLYVKKARGAAEDIVARARDCGYESLVFTTDANVFGQREWDKRNYRAPGRPTWPNLLEVLTHPRWAYEVLLRDGIPQFQNLAPFLPPGAASAIGGSTIIPRLFAGDIGWEQVDWLRRLWPGKFLIKGILSLQDAERAAQAGCDGVILSNHGGRQLDHCVSAMDMLPAIAAHLGDRLTLIVDGGFRRGTDVIKAMALGAHGVMLGRATLYGLAAGGEAGVRRALEILSGEIDRTLGHLGCNSIAELGPQFLVRGGAGPGSA